MSFSSLAKHKNRANPRSPPFPLTLGPHIGVTNAWPMSLLMQAQTSDDDEEIMECIRLVLYSSQLGLVHESVNVNMIHSYTSKSTPPPQSCMQ